METERLITNRRIQSQTRPGGFSGWEGIYKAMCTIEDTVDDRVLSEMLDEEPGRNVALRYLQKIVLSVRYGVSLMTLKSLWTVKLCISPKMKFRTFWIKCRTNVIRKNCITGFMFLKKLNGAKTVIVKMAVLARKKPSKG